MIGEEGATEIAMALGKNNILATFSLACKHFVFSLPTSKSQWHWRERSKGDC
jgi:hypothetical protein